MADLDWNGLVKGIGHWKPDGFPGIRALCPLCGYSYGLTVSLPENIPSIFEMGLTQKIATALFRIGARIFININY